MTDRYDAQAFIKAINSKTAGKRIVCPFCGGMNFTSTEYLASVLIGEKTKGLSIGPTLPAGMLICEECGHIEFFALGALGLLQNEEDAEGIGE